MDPLSLVGVSGASIVVLQLVLLYVPKLNEAFAGLKSETKQAIILGLNVLVAAAWVEILQLGCFGLVATCPQVDKLGVFALAVQIGSLFLTNVGIQQGAFRLAKKPEAVTDAIAARDVDVPARDLIAGATQ